MEKKNKNIQKPTKPFKPRFNFYWVYLALLVFFLGSLFFNPEGAMREVAYSVFEKALRDGCVEKITVYSGKNLVEAKISPKCSEEVFSEKFDEEKIPMAKVRILSSDEFQKLTSELREKNIFTGKMAIEEGKDYWEIFLYSILPFLLLIMFFVFMSRRMGGGSGGGIFNVGKSKAQLFR